MKKFYFNAFLFWILILHGAFAQIQLVNPQKLVCPGVNISYSTFPASPGICTYTWTVTNGLFSNGSTTISGANLTDVTVVWNNVLATSSIAAPKGTLKVQVSNCTLQSGEPSQATENNIVIKTLNGVTPGAMSGTTTVPRGSTTSITYSIQKVLFPNTGQISGHPSETFADSYQWLIPVGWKIGSTTSNGSTPITGLSNSVSVIPSSCDGDGGKIRVRAYSSCGGGYVGSWREINITRPLPTLTFTQAPPTSVTCNVTTPITVSIAAVPGATSYTWTKPSGWTGTSTTNSINLTPNGTSVGAVTVKANLCGTQTAALSKTITMQLVDPSNPPTVSGTDQVCTTNSIYTLQNLPPGATATWTASPSALFTTSSGTGTTATLKAANNSSVGQGVLNFTITTACGVTSVTKSVRVGRLQPGSITFGLIDPIMGKLYAAVSPVPGATSYNWYIDGVLTDSHSSGAQMQIPRNRCGMEYDVSVEAVNSCGVSLRTHRNAYVPCDEYYVISPNPASGLVTVSLDNNQLKSMGNKSFDQIRIYDMEGNLKISQKFDKAESASLDVSKLINGTYLIEISAGVHNERKQLLVQK